LYQTLVRLYSSLSPSECAMTDDLRAGGPVYDRNLLLGAFANLVSVDDEPRKVATSPSAANDADTAESADAANCERGRGRGRGSNGGLTRRRGKRSTAASRAARAQYESEAIENAAQTISLASAVAVQADDLEEEFDDDGFDAGFYDSLKPEGLMPWHSFPGIMDETRHFWDVPPAVNPFTEAFGMPPMPFMPGMPSPHGLNPMLNPMMDMLYPGGQPPTPAGYTTVMLRNIPNRYSRDMLVNAFRKNYKGQFDFVHLPMDANSKCNVGYAFINFRTPLACQKFISEFNGAQARTVLPGFSSKKICEVSFAQVQGRDANMHSFPRDQKFLEKLRDHPEWYPLFFDEAGRPVTTPWNIGNKGKGGAGNRKTANKAATQVSLEIATNSSSSRSQPSGGNAAATASSGPPIILPAVLPNATLRTMLMVKNVPISYTRSDAVDFFNESYKGQFDFLWLKGVSKGTGNQGFVFINFRTEIKAIHFTSDFKGKRKADAFPPEEGRTDDEKVCDIEPANLDVMEASIKRVQSAHAAGDLDKAAWAQAAWLPVSVGHDGVPYPFPMLSP